MEILLAIVLFPIRLVRKLGKSASKAAKPIEKGFEWTCVKVYRFFKYAFKGLIAPFSALSSASQKMERYEKELRVKKKEQEQVRKQQEIEREEEKRLKALEEAEELRRQREAEELNRQREAEEQALRRQEERNPEVLLARLTELEAAFLRQKEELEQKSLEPQILAERLAELESNFAKGKEEAGISGLSPRETSERLTELERMFAEQKGALNFSGLDPQQLLARQTELEAEFLRQKEELEIQTINLDAISNNATFNARISELENNYNAKREAVQQSGLSSDEVIARLAELEEAFLKQKEELDYQSVSLDAITSSSVFDIRMLELEHDYVAQKQAVVNSGLSADEIAVKLEELENAFNAQKEELELQSIQMYAMSENATFEDDLASPITRSEAIADDRILVDQGFASASYEPILHEEAMVGVRDMSDIEAEVAEIEEEKQEAPKPEERPNFDASLFEEEEVGKKGIGYRINQFLERLFAIPANYFAEVKRKREAKLEEKARKNGDINRQAMVLDFESAEDTAKEATKVMWEYVCKSPEGKIIKGYFAAFSKLEVHSFLQTQGMIIYSIRTNKWIQRMYSSVNGNGAKLKRKDLIFFLTQLSTYIKSGIPLVEAMNILTRQFKDKNYQRMFRSMMYDLTMGESFSKSLENQGDSFPTILINMVKSSELTGELPETLDDMCNYFEQLEEAKKEMISALMYPSIVLVMAIGVTVFMLIGIVPQFADMFTSMDSEIPAFTKFVLAASEFLQTQFIWIIVGVTLFITIMVYLYRNVKIIKVGLQKLAMHIPVMGEIIIYNEVAMFSKTFSSLLSHNVFITDSMKVLRKITRNEIYKAMIFETVTNLSAGEKISEAFKDHWAFPVPAYEMIVTGEKTGQLAEMMAKVSTYYQSEHKNAVTRVKAFMEPLIIVFLTVVVGAIVLSIIIPMFSMYQSVQNM